MDIDQRAQHRREIARLHDIAAQFRVETRGIGNIGDKARQALDIVHDDRQQALLLDGIVDPHGGFDRAAQGR